MSNRPIRSSIDLVLACVAIVGYLTAVLAINRCEQLSHRVVALERRAAWFMPPGQEHPQEVRR